jgi:hypothetical protein
MLPNIGYLGRGYDILFGNPLPSGLPLDPGYRDPIFQMTAGSQLINGFSVPSNVSAGILKLTLEREVTKTR